MNGFEAPRPNPAFELKTLKQVRPGATSKLQVSLLEEAKKRNGGGERERERRG